MQVRSYTDARNNLKECLDAVHDRFEPLLITRQKGGNVVLVAESEWNSIEETLYLLGNKANAERLFRSIEDLEAGRAVAYEPEHRDAAE